MRTPMRPTPRRRPRGRPASKKDKNGRPMPVRADRDRFIQWFFQEVPGPAFDDALMVSGDEQFHRLNNALHDDIYRNVSPGTALPQVRRIVDRSHEPLASPHHPRSTASDAEPHAAYPRGLGRGFRKP